MAYTIFTFIKLLKFGMFIIDEEYRMTIKQNEYDFI